MSTDSILLQLLAGRQPGRIPVIFTGAALAARMAGCSLAEIRDNGALLAEVQDNFQKETGMDWCVVYADALAIPEALGIPVEISPVSGPVGRPGPVPVEIPVLVPRPFFDSPGTRAILEAVQILKKKRRDLPVAVLFEGPFTTAMRLFEPEELMREIFRRPALVKNIAGRLADVLGSFAAAARRAGADLFYIPEPFASLDMISPRHFREFAGPFITGLIKHIHSMGAGAILHICGFTAGIWLDMAATGANALSLDQKMSMKQARDFFGPGVVLAGNVDPLRTLMEGDPSRVGEETRRCVTEAGPKNLIVMPGCGVPPQADPANLRVMVETVREIRL